MPNVMAALGIYVAPSVQNEEERNFRRPNSVPCSTPQSLADDYAGVPCSNAANTGERNTWTQSEFCNWQNSVRGQKRPKMYTGVPAQETAKHRAKFG